MKPKNKRLSSVLQKSAKRGIRVKGKWKAVELDPSLFSEEGMEGLVCFEELTDYRPVDSEKAAAKAAKALKREKKKAMKRKASEREEGEEKADVEVKEGEETTEPAKKKAKKKKKTKKRTAKDSAQQDISTEVTQNVLAANEEGGEDQTTEEDASKDVAVTSNHEVQSKNAKKSNKRKKKKQMHQIEKDTVTETDPKTPSELQALETEKKTQDKVTKPPKKQAKNWTNRALSGSDDKNTDVTAWKDLFVPSPVLQALSCLGFGSPTPIQALALPPAIRDRMDILGAAETGGLKISVTLYYLSKFLSVYLLSKYLQVELM